ncbi:hypothetical protein BV20DRAFT_1123119 [Pilatotrama ljubarskyi]|nr:hypothetical protein BV20DRAFT_1123119 [Pilatotrama ljubarskyi]
MQVLRLAHAMRDVSRLAARRCDGWKRTPPVAWTPVRGMSESSQQDPEPTSKPEPTSGPELTSKPENKRPIPDYDGQSLVLPWTVRSLRPHNLTPEDYLDLSNARALAVDPTATAETNAEGDSPKPLPPFITYGFRKPFTFTHFPVNTRGFFYYCHHEHVPLGGSIRFRVMQDADPKRFRYGQDLLNEYGTPWELSLPAIFHLKRYTLLWNALRRDRVHSYELLKENSGILKSTRVVDIRFEEQLIRGVVQPFYVDLADGPSQKIHFVGADSLHFTRANRFFVSLPPSEADHKRQWLRNRWPFLAGQLLCRFELIGPHKDDPEPSLVIRVLRIIEPVRMVDRRENILKVDVPFVPGSLITVGGGAQPLIVGEDELPQGVDIKWAFAAVPPKFSAEGQPRARRLDLRTLDPAKLSPRDYVDLSGLSGYVVDRQAEGPPRLKDGTLSNINYDSLKKKTADGGYTFHDAPFPANSQGFLYFRARPHAEVAGSVRFRVTQGRDPEYFAHGEDLLTVFGKPWQIPLVTIASSPRCVVLRKYLERDALVTFEALEQCEKLARTSEPVNLTATSQVVCEVEEPFHINLRASRGRIFVAGDHRLYHLLPRDIFLRDPRNHPEWPYEAGVLVCQLEFFGEKDLAIGLRVLRIAEPVRLQADMREGHSSFIVDDPREGELLCVEGMPRSLFAGTAGATVKAVLARRTYLKLQALEEDMETPREVAELGDAGR